MTVAELKAILDTLPDDMEVRVSHEQHGTYSPELFENKGLFHALIIVPFNKKGMQDAARYPHWRRITKANET